MIFDKYLIFTNIMCNNCILSNIYIGTKEGVTKNMSGANGGRILTYKGKDESNTPIFSMYKDSDGNYPTGSFTRNLNYSECWKLQIGLRYVFN